MLYAASWDAAAWNDWRQRNPDIVPDLRGADLVGFALGDADLSRANLARAHLSRAKGYRARLAGADLTHAKAIECGLLSAVSAWGLDLSKVRDQTGLRITPEGRAGLTVDNLELAQFVYLLVHNEKIRGIIDTIGRKAVLDALKARLRELDLVPIVFDRDKPSSRDLTETVALLANMSRFVVADVTDAKSIPQELAEIVPRLPSVPVQPILLRGDPGYAMFEHWKGYRTMLPVFEYRDQAHLLDNVRQAILEPVRAWETQTTQPASLADELKARDEEILKLRAMLQARRDGG